MGGPEPSDYEAIEIALAEAGADADAAQLHGHLCGLTCVLGTGAAGLWLAQAFEVSDQSGAAPIGSKPTLERLAVDTADALEAGDMSLALLLPPDDEPLEERAASLAHWCQGFVHALHDADPCAAQSGRAIKSDTAKEIIADFREISRAVFAEDETQIEAESAYAELVEYVRVGVQLIFEDLDPWRSRTHTAVH